MILTEKFKKSRIEKKRTKMIEYEIKRTALQLLGKEINIQFLNDIKELSIESMSKLHFTNDELFNKP